MYYNKIGWSSTLHVLELQPASQELGDCDCIPVSIILNPIDNLGTRRYLAWGGYNDRIRV